MALLIVFTRLTWPSTLPELHSWVSPAVTASKSWRRNAANLATGTTSDRSAWRIQADSSWPRRLRTISEGPGEVAGPHDIRAGEAGLVEVLDLLGAEAVAVAHDPCGDPAWARDLRWCGRGRAGFQGPQVGGECRVAAAESAFADLAEQHASVGDACGVLLLQVRLECIQLLGAAVSGAVEEVVEAGVAVAADRLSVEAEAARDVAERVASGDHVRDFGVVVENALDDARGRQGVHQRHLDGAVASPFHVLLQAWPVLMARLLNGVGEVLEQVPAVGDLQRGRGRFAC